MRPTTVTLHSRNMILLFHVMLSMQFFSEAGGISESQPLRTYKRLVREIVFVGCDLLSVPLFLIPLSPRFLYETGGLIFLL